MEDVTGYCPACGHKSMFLASGGYVTCSIRECPNPTIVADLLEDRETHHIVTFRAGDFTIRHPLRERIGTDLEDCALHTYVAALAGPPVKPGRYRAVPLGDRWTWQELAPVDGGAS